MPEIGEVAHAKWILETFANGRQVTEVIAPEDALLFASPTTNETFSQAALGATIKGSGRHGKYFWVQLDNGKFIAMHFGMTGWIKIKDQKTHFIRMEGGGDKLAHQRLNGKILDEPEEEVWPPKFTKFELTLKGEGSDAAHDVRLAFTDPRRLGRVRVLEAADETELLALDPLAKLGCDFSLESRWSKDQFITKMKKKKSVLKSTLMDQAICSGVGNWIADEILYQSRLHPATMIENLSDSELGLVYDKLVYICTFAVDVLGDALKFPEDWLMLYRWGKGRKEKQKTKQGQYVDHITVGGRTSCYVPELQKSKGSGRTIDNGDDDTEQPAKSKAVKRRTKAVKVEVDDAETIEENKDIAVTESVVRVTRETKPKRQKVVKEPAEESKPVKKRGAEHLEVEERTLRRSTRVRR